MTGPAAEKRWCGASETQAHANLGADFDNDAGTRTLDRGAQVGVRLRF